MESDRKLADIYYSPRGYWKGLAAIKKLATAAKVTEQQTKDWLKKQAIWQIYLPAPRQEPVCSLDVYRLGRSVTKPDEPVLYYLQGDDAPQRGFVREELLAVPSDTQLPPDGGVLLIWI